VHTYNTIAVNDLDPKIVGETAAVVTSCLWTIATLFFFSAGKRIGSLSVNAYRIIMGVGFLVLAHAILLGTMLPMATNEQWFWMGMSGVVHFGIGDFGFFMALLTLGPRRLVLVGSLSPIFASMVAYLMLGEIIPSLAIVGIAMTLGGVVVVMLEEEERSGEEPISKKQRGQGVFLALIGAIGQGVGFVLAKKGIYSDPEMMLNPLSATLMRAILAALFVWTVVVVAGKLPELRKAIKSKDGIGQTAAGTFLGMVLGAAFSMVAVTYTSTGIAQTLMSLMPVLMIPMTWILYKQRTSFRGILGAAMAVIGVSILFLT
jgi:drug/metabolite transporter (DMT)-like permease